MTAEDLTSLNGRSSLGKSERVVTKAELKKLESEPFLIHKGTIKGTTHDESTGMDFPLKLPRTYIVIPQKGGKKIVQLV